MAQAPIGQIESVVRRDDDVDGRRHGGAS
jgi:hypothetical protein